VTLGEFVGQAVMERCRKVAEEASARTGQRFRVEQSGNTAAAVSENGVAMEMEYGTESTDPRRWVEESIGGGLDAGKV
jgi:hypothetical protein